MRSRPIGVGLISAGKFGAVSRPGADVEADVLAGPALAARACGFRIAAAGSSSFRLSSLVTGIVQTLGTTCGLVRHYRVLAKLLVTVSALGGKQ